MELELFTALVAVGEEPEELWALFAAGYVPCDDDNYIDTEVILLEGPNG